MSDAANASNGQGNSNTKAKVAPSGGGCCGSGGANVVQLSMNAQKAANVAGLMVGAAQIIARVSGANSGTLEVFNGISSAIAAVNNDVVKFTPSPAFLKFADANGDGLVSLDEVTAAFTTGVTDLDATHMNALLVEANTLLDNLKAAGANVSAAKTVVADAIEAVGLFQASKRIADARDASTIVARRMTTDRGGSLKEASADQSVPTGQNTSASEQRKSLRDRIDALRAKQPQPTAAPRPTT